MTEAQLENQYFLCTQNQESDDLEKGKVYVVLPDAKAKRDGYLRVVDASEENYLYPESYFVQIELPNEAKTALGSGS